ncbi:MAG: ATP-binding protein [Anaerolineae bacterium]
MNVLKPAIRLMSRLKYPQKFLLVGILVLIPLLVTMQQFLSKINEDIDFAAKEQLGLTYNNPLVEFFYCLQDHAALSVAVASGDAAMQIALADQQVKVEDAMAIVDAVDQRSGATLEAQARWEAIKSSWNELKAGLANMTSSQTLEKHQAISDATLRLITVVGNSSNLILDPDIDSYYYMDTVITKVPLAASYLSQIRAYGTQASESGSLSPETATRLTILDGQVSSTLDSNLEGFGYSFELNPALQPGLQGQIDTYVQSVRSFSEQLKTNFLQNSAGDDLMNASELFQKAGDPLAANAELYRDVAAGLDDLLQARIGRFEVRRTLVTATALLGLAIAIYLLVGFYLAVQQTIRELDEASQRMVKGDREWDFQPSSSDELAQVAVSFNSIASELVVARDQALDSSRAKTSFLANMSHELRTPLNAILGFSTLLSSGMVKGGVALAAPQADLLKKIDANGKRLRDLINDVLDLAKIESGSISVSVVPGHPRVFLEETVSAVRSLATSKNLQLELNVASDVPEVVLTDVRKVQQVVTNLLGNALKFTEKGGVWVDVVMQDDSQWQISIRDTGIGIPPESLSHIFEKFSQVDETDRRQYEGSGLGLAIVKNLVECLRGDIRVESQVKQGSVFTLTLPKRLEVEEG